VRIRAVFDARMACLILLAALTPTSLAGQTSSDSPVSTDGFLVLVPLRDVADIDANTAAADADLGQAARTVQQAADLRAGTRAQIEEKKQDIVALKRRTDLAKGSNNEAEATGLDAERKALEREKELLEQRELLGNAEIDLARRSGELARMAKRALEFERQLMLKRNERLAITEQGPATSSLERVILDLEQQTLNAQVTQADKKIEVATLERRVADRLLKILAARRRVVVS
jgi:hypothetical protein